MASFKTLRVQQLLLEEISALIALKAIKDPRVNSHAMVMNVKVSGDTTRATVFISGYCTDEVLEKTIAALNHARGFIQRRIAEKYALRHTPKLLFKKSEALIKGDSVLKSIHEIESIQKVKSSQEHLQDNFEKNDGSSFD